MAGKIVGGPLIGICFIKVRLDLQIQNWQGVENRIMLDPRHDVSGCVYVMHNVNSVCQVFISSRSYLSPSLRLLPFNGDFKT